MTRNDDGAIHPVTIAILPVFGVCLSCAIASPAGTPAMVTPRVIGIGDALALRVKDHPELEGQMVVRKDGTIALPWAKSISVSQLTLREAAQRISRSLTGVIADPLVTIEYVGPPREKIELPAENEVLPPLVPTARQPGEASHRATNSNAGRSPPNRPLQLTGRRRPVVSFGVPRRPDS